MRTQTLGLVALLCSALMLSGGCAKKEMVKPEEALPQAAAPQPTPVPVPTPPPAPPVKEEMVAAQPVTETPVRTETPQDQPLRAEAAEVALERVHFDFDSFVLTHPARDTLNRNAEFLLKKQPGVKVLIEGHSDERGSDEYNLALGEKRAKSAQSYLETLGVPAERLSVISYGKEKPLDPGSGEAAWARNRRAEFVIVK